MIDGAGGEWYVAFRPAGMNPGRRGKNDSGLVVLLTDGSQEHETGRVAFRREDSKNPDVPFEDQLQAEIDKAQQAVEALNAALDEFERIRDDEVARARDRIRTILGDSVEHALA